MTDAGPALRAMLAALLYCAPMTCALAGWVLEHDEDFSVAQALDRDYWVEETGFIRNRESQYYSPANLSVRPGALVLEARRDQVANAAWQAGSSAWRSARRHAQYTSAAIVSRQTLLYGRIEVVARSPSGAGVWPAIWLLHESDGHYGEIDVYEAVGKHPDTAFAAVHYGRQARTRKHHNASRLAAGFDGPWHTHGLEWTPERIAITLDGQPLLTFDPADAAAPGFDPLRRPMRLRINLALGGSWGGPIDDTQLPARFEIASIKTWRWQPEVADAPAPQPAASTRSSPSPTPIAVDSAPLPRWGR